jgi:rhomboid protease GluP
MYVTLSSIKKKIVTIVLASINIIVYLVVNVYLGEIWLTQFAQQPYSILHFGQYYRLFTAMFVHADLMHLLSNMLALVIFGLLVENRYSILQYLFIYFISGLIGNVVSLFILPEFTFSLGASGCIFGVMAAYYVSFTAYDKRMILYAIVSSALMVAMSIGADINSWAHIIGAVGGLLFGFIFTQYNKRKLHKNINSFSHGRYYNNSHNSGSNFYDENNKENEDIDEY